MKTINKLALAALTATVFASGSAFASDWELRTFDNHHGSITYFYRTPQKEATVAVYSHGKGVGRADGDAERHGQGLQQFNTAHGAVSYYAPVASPNIK